MKSKPKSATLSQLKALKAKLSTDAPPVSETEARRRLAVAEAKRAETRNRREEGQLVAVAEVESHWADVATRVRNAVLGLPSRVVNRLSAEIRREVFPIATDEARRLLTALSDEIRSTKTTPAATSGTKGTT